MFEPDGSTHFAVDSAGIGWVVADNDGVADSPGATLFWPVGTVHQAYLCVN